MSVATEEKTVLDAFATVEEVESVIATLPPEDERRQTLCAVIERTLKSTPPVRPVTAAQVLGLTEKTIRSWVDEGVLTASRQRRLLLDPERLHEVLHLVRDVREAGKTRGLLDEVYRRLSDQALLDRGDLTKSIEQMRRGEGEVLRSRAAG